MRAAFPPWRLLMALAAVVALAALVATSASAASYTTCHGRRAGVKTIEVKKMKCRNGRKVYRSYKQKCLNAATPITTCTVRGFKCAPAPRAGKTVCLKGRKRVRF